MGRLADGMVEDVHIALGSVAPVPLRLKQTEKTVKGKRLDSDLLLLAKNTAVAEIRAIDDIRSTARYRSAVAGNLVVEFLKGLSSTFAKSGERKDFLPRWNSLPIDQALRAILPCCGSKTWAQGMVDRRPFVDETALLAASNETWGDLGRSDWMEAFQSHPRIGESRAPTASLAQSVEWSAQEQRDVAGAETAMKAALANANQEYERRFNRIFIVCATGKSASEILEIYRRRLKNDPETELREAAEQQRQITQIRLKKWLQG
jgi:2-oxo-4-hydroxy-4-carboxy-5-ureidoimidazoline decarboxylase